MGHVNELVICRDEYNSTEDFENAIKTATMMLLNNDYIMTIRYDDKGLGIVVINYEQANQEYDGLYPYWLMPDDFETLISIKSDECEND